MKILLALISILFLTSCASMNKSQMAVPLGGHVESRLKADIAVDMTKKLKGQASATKLFGFFEISGPTKFADGVFADAGGGILAFGGNEGVKSGAAYNAVTSGKADVIVAPQYVIETQNYFVFSTVKATVTGYPGMIRKIDSTSASAGSASSAPAPTAAQ
jgi:hypothetical protein